MTRRRLFTRFLMMLAALSVAASAPPASAKGPADSQVRTVESAFKSLDKSLAADTLRVRSVDKKIQKIRERIDKIRAKDPSYDVSRFVQRIDAAEKLFNERAAGAAAAAVKDAIPPAPPIPEPFVGLEQAGPVVATWCDGVKARVKRVTPKNMAKMAADLRPEGIKKMGQLLCGAPQLDAMQAWTGHYLQQLINTYGVTLRDAQALVATFVAMKRPAREAQAGCGSAGDERSRRRARSGAGGGSAASLPQRAIAVVTGCANGEHFDRAWWDIDRDTNVGVAVSVANVLAAIPADNAQVAAATEGQAINHYALTAVDRLNLDETTFLAELKSAGVTGVQHQLARLSFSAATSRVAIIEARLDELAQASPVLSKARAAADAAVAAFADLKSKHADAFKFADAIEAATRGGDDSGLAGCDAQAATHLAAHFSRASPKTIDDARDAFADPLGARLARAAIACLSHNGHQTAAGIYQAELVYRRASFRGPRSLAEAAANGVLHAASFKDGGSPVSIQPFRPGNAASWHESGLARFNLGQPKDGIAKHVKVAGREATLSFKKQTYKARPYVCRDTNRIERIEADGTVHYKRTCSPGKKVITMTEHPASLTMPPFLAPIAKGHFVEFYRNNGQGMPLATYTSPDRKRLLTYLGLAL